MGLLIFAGLLTTVVAGLAGLSVYQICKWLGRREIGERYGVLTGVVWAVMWFGPLMAGTVWLTTDLKIGLHGPPGDAALAWLSVPPGKANDVSYKRTYQRYYADFKMSESDFLAWMKAEGWQPKRFTFKEPWDSVSWNLRGENCSIGSMVTPVREIGTDKETFVLDGYMFADKPCAKAECLWTVIFDVENERVYVDH